MRRSGETWGRPALTDDGPRHPKIRSSVSWSTSIPAVLHTTAGVKASMRQHKSLRSC